jgi:uncharacterized protein YdeI (YjbR/CyaY-like superfamily)
MGKKDPRVDDYIAKAADFAKPILTHVREVMHTACPDVEENWKWSFPVFIYKGGILCNLAAFKAHCSFGFWKASLMSDPDNILETKDKDGMGHLGKIATLKDLPKDAVLKRYIKEAMKLNDDGVKLPPRKRPTEKQKSELVVPEQLAKALSKSKKARDIFEAFSYSHRKEYIRWIEEAKTDVTRDKRIAQAIEWMADGKGRNWKYENC